MEGFGLARRLSRKQDRLLDRSGDPSAAGAARFPGTEDNFAALVGEEFALLVTFRRSGEWVPTPVWFGMHDGACTSRASPMLAGSSDQGMQSVYLELTTRPDRA